MVNLNGFNAAEVEPSKPATPLPAGKYLVSIVESEDKPTKSGTGSYVQFTFEVLDGEHKGRKQWARLNLNNPSAQAVQIARAELSAICHAVNVLSPRDSQDLHNIPLVIDVVLEKRKDTGAMTNRVKSYHAKDELSALPEGVTAGATDEPAPWAQ